MGSYGEAAEVYDLIYAAVKDYADEAGQIRALLQEVDGPGTRLLDVACGTGRHAEELTALGFRVDGVDLEPTFVEIAQRRNPTGTFRSGDMADFTVGEPYDAVLCLFGSIGYALDEEGLQQTAHCLAAATRPGGLVLVEPWFAPEEMTHGHLSLHTARAEDRVVCRLSRTALSEQISTLHFEYLIGTREGIERRSESHQLGLFTADQMVQALRRAGLDLRYDAQGLMGRGLYIGRKS